MKKAGVLSILLVVVPLAVAAIAEAQHRKKVPRMCYLGGSNAYNSTILLRPFRERLREIGYVEGQNLTIESRHSEGKDEHLPELAGQLVRLNCDVIVTAGAGAAQAAKNATKAIPVVMGFGNDAVRLGIVADLAHPGGNITGLTSIGTEIFGKRLELLKETVPKLSQLGFLWSPTSLDTDYALKDIEPVARYLRVGIQSLEVNGPDDFDGAFRAATKGRADGVMLPQSGFFSFHRKRIIDLAEKNRLPAMYPSVTYVEAGGLMVYAEDRSEMFRRAAEIVDKVLKGTKPADIPVDRPKKFDFVINLKAAKQIGLTIPSEVLARANRLIK
jgi:putative ABC transport system substrate-binding protein